MQANYQFNPHDLVQKIQTWAQELGFSQIGITGIDVGASADYLQKWLERGFHGQMHYMHLHGTKRTQPAELVPGTVSIICARMDYLPVDYFPNDKNPPENPITPSKQNVLLSRGSNWRDSESARVHHAPTQGVISVYARGRDYHKVVRTRLQKLADRIAADIGPLGHRVFCDSAPVMEKPFALQAGLGWRGKHSLILSRQGGSTFFLGEIYVDIALPPTRAAVREHCGNCTSCITACPTGAIVEPYVVDARRCISYLTMVHDGPLPLEFRPLMGNRIYGCDDCQVACPWNKFSSPALVGDFQIRDFLINQSLIDLFTWDEKTFFKKTEGTAIRHMGYQRWLRNIAVSMGNAIRTLKNHPDFQTKNLNSEIIAIQNSLQARLSNVDEIIAEHIHWALQQ